MISTTTTTKKIKMSHIALALVLSLSLDTSGYFFVLLALLNKEVTPKQV